MVRRAAVRRLEQHPNLEEILEVRARVPRIGDVELMALAVAWVNDGGTALARHRALTPDSPLVLEVLTAFEDVGALFADDLDGEADYVRVDPAVTRRALKAVRDAIAGSYARPVLTRRQHAALMAPWRGVFPETPTRPREPDLGPMESQVQTLLGSLPTLADRCHDARACELFDQLVLRAYALDTAEREVARETAFCAAVLTSRRRLWELVTRTVTQALERRCPSCRAAVPGNYEQERDAQRVLDLCVDAACALLVADSTPLDVTAVLTDPLTVLPRLGA